MYQLSIFAQLHDEKEDETNWKDGYECEMVIKGQHKWKNAEAVKLKCFRMIIDDIRN